MLRIPVHILKALKAMFTNASYTPSHRLVSITHTDSDEYLVTIQLINKDITFEAKPEDILADDRLVDQFSPRDVRTLTYLGYLGVNNPKYKILAQRLSENSDKLLFAIQKKGHKNILTKTAEEIFKEKDILNNLNAQDSRVIGYTTAAESMLREKDAMLS